MRKLLLATAAAATIAAVQIPADAAADGFYVGVMGGFGWAQDVNADYSYGINSWNVDFESETGYVLGLGAGYKFDFGGRAEVEFGYRTNDVDTIVFHGPGVGGYAFDGDLDAYTLMANFWYDFDTGTGLMPYLGGGVGAARMVSDMGYAGGSHHSDDSDTAFAYQLGAGVNYAFNETLAVGFGYRFLGTTGFELENSFPAATNYDADAYYNHSVLLNLIVSFGGIE